MESKDQINALLQKYIEGQCTEDELRNLVDHFRVDDNEELLKAAIRSYFEQEAVARSGEDVEEQKALSEIYALLLADIARNEKVLHRVDEIHEHPMWRRIAAAAAILIFVSVSGYFILKPKQERPLVAQNDPEHISPVNKGVVLTIDDGRQINLAYHYEGRITNNVNQTGSTIKYHNNRPRFRPQINTLANNSGSKFRIMLADGTEAILDVASTLTYPEAFATAEREVSMTGQVYFIVKHDTKHPFRVKTKDQSIYDIGTEFNVNAYSDELATRTTLVSGSVKVKSADASVTLSPGEQAALAGNSLVAVNVKLEDVTAWLQGKMIFHHERLENIMKRVARIYDVKIIWQDEVLKDLTFGGSVSRSKSLATVLNFMRESGKVNFNVNGRIVKVLRAK